MTNDAKLGLVVGVGLVIVVAVIFFRQDTSARPTERGTPASVATSDKSTAAGEGLRTAVQAASMSRITERTPVPGDATNQGDR